MKKDTTETALITGSYGGLGRCFAALHAVRMATNEQIKTFSPPIFAAYCSKDGRTCIARLAAYKRLIGPMRYAIEETADACTVTLRPGDAALTIPAFLAEAEAAFLIALLRAATKEPIRPLRLTLATPPQSPALAELAGIPVSHAAENSITFAARDLARPFLSHDDAMWSYFEPELTRRLADLAVDDTTAARVQAPSPSSCPAAQPPSRPSRRNSASRGARSSASSARSRPRSRNSSAARARRSPATTSAIRTSPSATSPSCSATRRRTPSCAPSSSGRARRPPPAAGAAATPRETLMKEALMK